MTRITILFIFIQNKTISKTFCILLQEKNFVTKYVQDIITHKDICGQSIMSKIIIYLLIFNHMTF